MILFFLLVLIILVVFGLILYARWNYGILEKMGIPVEKPHLIFGNMKNLYSEAIGYTDIKNFKKFGNVFGVYEGREPQVFMAHPDLIRLVTSKDSDYFDDKRRIDFRDDLLNEMPDFQPYEKWKAIRNFLTPMFSTSKVKMMSESMVITLDHFADELKNQIKSSPDKKLEKYDLRDGIFVMITNMIARCAFSIEIENPMDPNNHFAKIVRNMFSAENLTTFAQTLEIWSYAFPILQRFAPSLFNPKGNQEFQEVFRQLIKARRQNGEKKRDVVDMAIELMDKVDTPEFKRLNITDSTIMCQAFVFFFAGQDQFSTITATLIYELLRNPDVEKRLYEEIDKFTAKHNGQIKHEDLPELQYLLACLNEALRLYPFFARAERVCTKDWKNEEFNLHIKKGMVVQIPIWAANRNPEYFPDPEKFDPERFLPERKEHLHPYAFTSFGFGPRSCIGMKFSYETLLFTTYTLLKNFKFHWREDSKLIYVPSGPFFAGHLPFYFDVTQRNK